MTETRLAINFRYLVGNEKSIESLEKSLDDTIDAAERTDHNFAYALNTAPNTPESVMASLMDLNKRALDHGISMQLTPGVRGVGAAYFTVCENGLSLPAFYQDDHVILALMDTDQFRFSHMDTLNYVEQLADKVRSKKAILGLGARDHVTLANTEELNDMRQIEEMYYAFVMGGIPVEETGIDTSKVPDAYMKWGDPIPGCYLFNLEHPRFLDWIKQAQTDVKRGNLNKFAGDGYMVMMGSRYGTVVSIRVPSPENPAGPFNTDTIRVKSVDLGKTEIRRPLIDAVRSSDNREELCEFYDVKLVDKTRDLMLEGLYSAC